MTALVNFVILIIVAAAVVFVLRWLRPRLREQRRRRWEQEGLLPHQIDPYAPREDESDTENGKPGAKGH